LYFVSFLIWHLAPLSFLAPSISRFLLAHFVQGKNSPFLMAANKVKGPDIDSSSLPLLKEIT